MRDPSRRRTPQTRRIGDVTLEPVWPLPDSPTVGPGDGSTANDASVVLLAGSAGVHASSSAATSSPRARRALAAALPGLHVDVLKVPHHGSRYQDLPFLQSLGARLAVVSVGADNDYGHPAPATRRGAGRDRRRGCCAPTATASVAVVERDGRLREPSTARLSPSGLRWRVGGVWQAVAPCAGPDAAHDVLGRVTLVTGKEEFLSERTVVGGARAPSAATTTRPRSPRRRPPA